MIQPVEEIPGAAGRPMWKTNMMIGIALCVVGVVLIVSVVGAIYGFVVLAVGGAWAIAAAMVGAAQERADSRRFHSSADSFTHA